MKNLLFLLAIVLFSSSAFAQTTYRVQKAPSSSGPEVRLNLYTLYAFDDHVDSYWSTTEYFEGTMKGGFQWGGGLEMMMDSETGVELSYLRLDSEAPMSYYHNGVQYSTFDYATNYVMLGGNRYVDVNDKVEPYAGFQIGLNVIDFDDQETNFSDRVTKFAWGIKLGLNIWASDKVALKLQTGMLSSVQSAGGGFYFGSGGGGAGVSAYSSIYQFNIGGGLTIGMGQ